MSTKQWSLGLAEQTSNSPRLQMHLGAASRLPCVRVACCPCTRSHVAGQPHPEAGPDVDVEVLDCQGCILLSAELLATVEDDLHARTAWRSAPRKVPPKGAGSFLLVRVLGLQSLDVAPADRQCLARL